MIIISVRMMVPRQEMQKIEENIRKQAETGIIVLPNYCDAKIFDENEIQVVPSEDDPERTASWKPIAEPSPFEIVYACSRCGRQIQVCWSDREIHEQFPYCHCGAKMIKETEDSYDAE